MCLASKPIITECGARIAQRGANRVYTKERLIDVEEWATHDNR